MNKKESLKRNSGKRMKPAKLQNKQRGSSVTELLFATASLGAAVFAMTIDWPKLPPSQGD